MGAKKQARARQKQAFRDAMSSDSSSSSGGSSDGEITSPPHLFQPGDDLGRFLIHIHTCKKNDSRRLGKFMPTLTRDLEKGKLSTEEVVEDMMGKYNERFINMGEQERIAIKAKLRRAAKMDM